jgi:hypothetical protein
MRLNLIGSSGWAWLHLNSVVGAYYNQETNITTIMFNNVQSTMGLRLTIEENERLLTALDTRVRGEANAH